MSWRETANMVIGRVFTEHDPKTEKEARDLLKEAYPFGQRKYHPYKIWLDAVKRALRQRFGRPVGQQLEITEGLFNQHQNGTST